VELLKNTVASSDDLDASKAEKKLSTTGEDSSIAEQTPWHLEAMPEMNESLFKLWVELVEARTGIRISEARRSFLLSKLIIRMREIKYDDYQQYYDLINDERNGLVEWETLVDRLTVHETRFWRNESIFKLIQDEYIEKNDLLKNDSLNIQLWSVGCATGEEPYSLAMWFEHFCTMNGVKNKQGIHATDISLAALSSAREGIYPENRLTNLPDGYVNYYLTKAEQNKYQVKDNIKERVCFTKLNLMKVDSFPFSNFDIIVCQNVMIYFDLELRVKLLNEFANYLKVGGILILGAGEVLGWEHPKMERIHFQSTLAFRRAYE